MTNKILGVGLVAVLVIATIGVFTPFGQSVTTVVKESVGAVAGPDVYDLFRAHNGLIVGGTVNASTTGKVASVTLSADVMCNNSIHVTNRTTGTGGTPVMNLTTAASSSIASTCLPEPGMSKEFLYRNVGAAATTTTFVAGTGVTLLEHDGGDVVIPGGEWARVIMTNIDDSTFTIEVDSVRDAD